MEALREDKIHGTSANETNDEIDGIEIRLNVKNEIEVKETGIATAALADALNPKHEHDTRELRKKEKQFAKMGWKKIAGKKGGYKLLLNAYRKCEANENLSMEDAIAELSFCSRYWYSFRDGKVPLIWWLLTVVFATGVAVAVILFTKEVVLLPLAVLGPVLSAFLALYKQVLDGLKTVTTVIEDKIGQDSLGPLDEIQEKLKHDINLIKSRVWVKDGESLDDIVRTRLGSGSYVNEYRMLF